MSAHGLRRFDGKIALIMGGATGIGAATARRLAAEGARVVIADLAAAPTDALIESLNDGRETAFGVTCDIGIEDEVGAAVAKTVERFGGLDALHVNAADVSLALRDTTAVDVPLEVFDRALSINLRGHLLATRHAVPVMLKRGGGAIVYTSSRAGLTSEPVRVSYGVSKAGLHGLMRHVALSWGKQGIRANVVAPGTTMTPPLQALGQAYADERLRVTPSPRLGSPEDIAAGVAFLLSDDAAFVNGQVLSIDGGATMR